MLQVSNTKEGFNNRRTRTRSTRTNRLKNAKRSASTTATATSKESSESTALLSTGTSSLGDSTAPLLICTLIDGSVVALDSETGEVSSLFSTGRELVANQQGNTNNLVVPDLEGNLYWKRTMQVLPVTIDEILQAPVQTCVEDDDVGDGSPDCGIVTGTKLTSLYGIDAASGKLVWTSHASSGRAQQHQPNNVVVLQREDYIVQQISTATGHQVWNVTLGRFSALDFGAPKGRISSATKPLLLDDDGVEDEDDDDDEYDTTATAAMNMPLIAFDGRGQVLNVLDTDTQEVVWRRQFPKVIARVYGLSDGIWVPLTVVDPNEGNDSDDDEEDAQGSIPPPPLMLSLPSANDSSMMDDKDVIYELLVRQQLLQTAKWQDKTLDVYHPPQQHFLPSGNQQQQQESDFTAACILEGVCSSNAPSDERQPFVKIPAGVEGHIPVMAPASHYANIPVVPPAPVVTTTTHQGVFLTWSMVAAIVMTLLLVIVALFFMYQKKKEAWLTQANAVTPVMRSSNSTALVLVPSPPRLELERNASAPMESMSMRSSYNNNTQTSNTSVSITATTSTALVKRALSMPVFGDKSNRGSMDENDRSSSLEESQQLLSHQEQPLTHQKVARSPMLTSRPSNLNGVPLVLYSRYRSEFQEISSLGKGGFGSVFECENMLDGRKYAIKKVNVQVFENDEDLTNDRLQRVLREVKILAQLDNPNIVRYYTAWLEAEEVTTDTGGSRLQESTMGDDDYTLSKFPSKCYSSSLLLHSTTNDLNDERPSDMGRPPLPKKKTSNPLGWNNDFANDFSSQALSFGRHLGSVESLEDYGFHFDRQNTTTNNDQPQGMNEHPTTNKSVTFHPQVDDDYSSSSTSTRENLATTTEEPSSSVEAKGPKMRHILYIQMQLCRHRTLADFLGNPQARKALENGKGGSNNHHGIDIPYALTLFHQVAQGVQYVHSRDLIHRDLKPNNCFMDESGIVKVGDFGLSREGATNEDMDESLCSGSLEDGEDANANGLGGDNTAGVGTRSYASPEQINGSDYDASTDIFSLGFILFELCYPMYTGMERHMVFSRLRQREFPKDWRSGVAKNFPSLDVMLFAMLSPKPTDRPSAHVIVQKMEKLLSEFTVQSIDASLQENSLILLRVEAEPSDGVLAKTIKLIRESAVGVSIDQYGLRGGEAMAIIEFALSDTDHVGLDSILAALQACPEIKAARQVVSSKNHRRERSQSTSS